MSPWNAGSASCDAFSSVQPKQLFSLSLHPITSGHQKWSVFAGVCVVVTVVGEGDDGDASAIAVVLAGMPSPLLSLLLWSTVRACSAVPSANVTITKPAAMAAFMTSADSADTAVTLATMLPQLAVAGMSSRRCPAPTAATTAAAVNEATASTSVPAAQSASNAIVTTTGVGALAVVLMRSFPLDSASSFAWHALGDSHSAKIAALSASIFQPPTFLTFVKPAPNSTFFACSAHPPV